MKKKLIILFLLVISLLIVGFISYKTFLNNTTDNVTLVSPIPDFLEVSKNNEVSSLNLWLPTLVNLFFGKEEELNISARSALVFDTTTNKVLYEKNSNEKLPMASLTKIMTAIVAIEHKKVDDKYVVTRESLVGENSMGLTEGEILKLNDLLYGLMLVSGNDAAEVIASNFIGGREKFIFAMNEKAKALGLTNTHFTNPSGLEGDGDQYTTPYDLMVITEYAMSNFPTFNKIVSTIDYEIPSTYSHKKYYLENETNLLTSYPGVKGVKTGYTPEAGLCLVTYLDYKGHKIIGIILGSGNRRQEMKDLLDYSLNSLGVTPPKHD